MSLIYNIVLKKPALKFLKKQDKENQERILDALEGQRKPPFVGDIKKLKGEEFETYRVCVGTYRLLFTVDHFQQQVIIEIIGNRGDVYK